MDRTFKAALLTASLATAAFVVSAPAYAHEYGGYDGSYGERHRGDDEGYRSSYREGGEYRHDREHRGWNNYGRRWSHYENHRDRDDDNGRWGRGSERWHD